MKSNKSTAMFVTAAAALGVGLAGYGIASAASSVPAPSPVQAETDDDGNDSDTPLTGSDLDQAVAAALDHLGEGTVLETEVGDDGAAFGVELQLDDGSQVEVNLDAGFAVINVEPDDD